MPLRIELLHTKGCQGYHRAIDALTEALVAAGMEPRFELVLVRDDREAERLRFFGSPTIRINGVDIDPNAASITRFGTNVCRPYFSNGKAYDYPPTDLILAALERHREGNS